MKNKKGFTLIELLAVIVVLSLILVIATLSIQRFITKGRSKDFDVLVNSFQDSAKTAYTECILKPNSDFCVAHPVPDYNQKVTVTLGDLIEAEYSDILKNPWKTSEECDRQRSTVTLTRKESSQIAFDYETCLVCGDKSSCDTNNGNGNGENGSGNGNGGSNPTPTPGKKTLGEMILEDNPTIYTNPTVTTRFEMTCDNSGLYSMSVLSGFGGGSGTTYYFRGNVNNNYVSFAGKTWRIVRINEDGTIRLVLEDADTTTSHSDIRWNNVGKEYLYYSINGIKNKVDNWYNSNIGNNAEYAPKVASGNYFCETYKDTDYIRNHQPNLTCTPDENGKSTVNSSVGLITYDEAVLAGMFWTRSYVCDDNNEGVNTYLQKSYNWQTMTPSYYYRSYEELENVPAIWVITSRTNAMMDGNFINIGRLRPVINLKADVTATKDSNGYYVVD